MNTVKNGVTASEAETLRKAARKARNPARKVMSQAEFSESRLWRKCSESSLRPALQSSNDWMIVLVRRMSAMRAATAAS